MTGTTGLTGAAPAPSDDATAAPTPAQGWYFYGIAARDEQLRDQVSAIEGMPGGGALQAIAVGAVAALAQPVSLDEFGQAALAARLEDLAWLEVAARRHHAVIATVHQQRALLPARFGIVYLAREDVSAALAAAQDVLLAQLDRVADCDEWEVRLYAERAEVLRGLDDEHPALAQLRQEMEAATPGRAYLLRRKLDGERERVGAARLDALAADALAHLERYASAIEERAGSQDAQNARRDHPAAAVAGEDELLRANVLVSRARLAAFETALANFAAAHAGTRWTRSGPWPPYSFATPLDTHREDGAP